MDKGMLAAKIKKEEEKRWMDYYHDTDKEVYSEIIFSVLLGNARKHFLSLEQEADLKELYKALMKERTPEGIIAIKKAFHSITKGV